MTKTQRNIIFIAVLLIAGGLFWFIWVNRKRSKAISEITTGEVVIENGVVTSNPTELDLDKLLKFGSYGEEVKELQRLTNKMLQTKAYDLAYLDVDGDFGSLTEQAVQNAYGLTELTLTDAIQYNNLFNI